jgi:hypothetical protein
MHDIEPHYNWRSLYTAEEDEHSPFYGKEYDEFEFTNSIYGYCIHPQWDDIGTPTLFVKIIFADYDEGFAIIEMLGEWNDCINNDIMFLKRDVMDKLTINGINKFILVGENVLNFHYSDESYYEELQEDIQGGWTALLGFRQHVLKELERCDLLKYFLFDEELNGINWRTYNPVQLFKIVESFSENYLPAGEE